ncbi:hypothetical protein [Noviherbaspirillum sp. Root189]|uniref:hypothetical protein n=1 Tax=Noviherbaspirillum sp. Root189 TaxID=1736487 RepID=UPI00070AC618|nr:hypothetical protein [Noviherbaspirillum sp. Root189]KRB71311.1 hypothetical protein ASE07_27250 [Noviherbaspirillum sp. Root189]
MNRAIIAMVVACSFQMLNFVSNVEEIFSRQPATLHSKTMQRQQEQQENADDAMHGNLVRKNVG